MILHSIQINGGGIPADFHAIFSVQPLTIFAKYVKI